MYKVEIDRDGYALHTIANADGTSQLTVIPCKGGIISSFIHNGQEIFYFDRSTLHSKQGIRGGNPVLFPTCGRQKDGCYKVGDKVYYMPLHGLAGYLCWKVKETGENPDPFITIELESGILTKRLYPFDFRVVLTYTLTNDGLRIKQKYINEGTEEMPFYAGFHPYFLVKDKNRLELEINADYYMGDDEKSIDYTGKIDFSKPVDFVFPLKSSGGNTYSLKDPVLGRKITIKNGDPFKYLVLWTENGKDFVCVEPWMAAPNALNTGKDLQCLAPGKSLETSTDYIVEFI